MRIAIVGSHSTGKTTLLRTLSEYLSVPTLSEVAREKINESPKLPHHMTPEERGELQTAILDEQIRRELGDGQFLSDRSVFDAVAYSFDTPSFESLRSRAFAHAETQPYDRIFFLPAEFPLEGDDIRSQDEAYRKTVENELVNLLEQSGAGYETVR